eukprot:scpid94404/ scgid27250/ 
MHEASLSCSVTTELREWSQTSCVTWTEPNNNATVSLHTDQVVTNKGEIHTQTHPQNHTDYTRLCRATNNQSTAIQAGDRIVEESTNVVIALHKTSVTATHSS